MQADTLRRCTILPADRRPPLHCIDVDAAGARYVFAWGAAGYAPSPPTPRHAGTTLAFTDVGGTRIATLVDGDATRTFERADAAGTRYVVSTVATRARTLDFAYGGGRLSSVSSAARWTRTAGPTSRSPTTSGGG